MATLKAIGGSQAIAQITTATPTASNNATYTLTINGKDAAYTADASATVAEITAGLLAAVQDLTDAEWAEVTTTDETTLVQMVAVTDGKPFTVSGAATAGSLTVSTTTNSKGPNHWDDAENWSGGAIPVNSDDVNFENLAVDYLYGIDQNAVTLTSLNIKASYTGSIGLPNYGNYAEYREKYLKIGATTCNIGVGDGQGSGRIKINFGSVQTAVNVWRTASPLEQGLPAVMLVGTHASNVLNVYRGSVGVALESGQTSTIATLRVGYMTSVDTDANVRLGSGVTLTTIEKSGGFLEINSAFTTLNHSAGETVIHGSGAATTINLDGGYIRYNSSGTITTLTISGGATIDFSGDMRAKTVTNCTILRGGRFIDPYGVVTVTNGWDFYECRHEDCEVVTGTHYTLTKSSI